MPVALGELKAARREQHLCFRCSHSLVCIIGRAARDLDELLVTVTACAGFDDASGEPPADEG